MTLIPVAVMSLGGYVLINQLKKISGIVVRMILFGLVVQMWIFPCLAFAEGETPKTVASAAIGGGGTSGVAETPLPDFFIGAMSYQIPIEVPPGRNGMDPGLALSYSSINGNGKVGVGWELEVGAIERSTRHGVDYTKDYYVLRRAGALSELIKIPNGDFRSKIESDFTRVQKQSDGSFIATNKLGVMFYFGRSDNSRISGMVNNTPVVFSWSLDKIEDTNGNIITFTYTSDGLVKDVFGNILSSGQLYLDHIDYNGNQIKFYLDDRDDKPDMFNSKFPIKTVKRLKLIDVLAADGSRVRTYRLVYGNNSPSTGRSLLASLELFGKDATVDANGNVTAPAPPQVQSFSYNQSENKFNSPNLWLGSTGPSGVTFNGDFQFTGDFNGDGMMDYMYFNGGWYVAKSNGNGFDTPQLWLGGMTANPDFMFVGDFNVDNMTDYMYYFSGMGWYVAKSSGNEFNTPQPWLDGMTANPGYMFTGDFNGDGKTDYMYYFAGTGWYVALSNGNSFDPPKLWLGGLTTNPGYMFVADFNGDGKSDYMYYFAGMGWYVALSNGSNGFEIPQLWLGGMTANLGNMFIGDFNGDGMTDYMYYFAGSGWYVALSNGNGFETPQLWLGGLTANPGYMFVGDFNGDGKTDYMFNYGGLGWYVALSNGNGFETPQLWLGGLTANPGYMSIGDFNGDGKTDYMYNFAGLGWYVAQSLPVGDLLTTVKNNTGGTTTISYTPSTKFNNPSLPFPVQTVSKIASDSGGITEITYEGGNFYKPERDFRGFNHVTVKGPADANGVQKITETWFHQGIDTNVVSDNASVTDLKALANVPTGYMKGKPYRTRITDSSGKKYNESTTSYGPVTNAPPYFNQSYQVDSYIYDGDASYTQTRSINTFDDYGNVVREEQHGDIATTTDDRTTVRTFLPNISKWIVGLPASEEIYEGIGTAKKIAGKTYYYDDLTDCNAAPTNNQIPVYGKLTRVVSWLSGGTSPEARMAYDSFGNLKCQRDPKGNTTYVSYDTSNTFPTLVTNPLGHIAVSQYYGVGGVPADKGLYGQPKSLTDPNNATTVMEYDVFGRKTKETLPDGTWTSMSYNNFGTASQHIRTASSTGLWKESYFDGLGRTTQEKSKGPDQKTIVRDTTYNPTGTVKETSLPYFAGLETPLYTTYDYDPLGRVTKVTNPDTTFNLACYNGGVTVKIDANGHRRREVRDAYGRLVKIQEYKGVYSTCSTVEGTPYATTIYTYDVLGNLRFVTDAKGNQTEMRYDTLGRKYYMNDPDMGIWGYSYDANSNLASQTDANGQTITFIYDALNRLNTKHYPSGQDVVMSYDAVATGYFNKGRLTKMTDGSGQAVYNYDTMGRISNNTKTINGSNYTLGFTYLNGRLDRITYPDYEAISYGYNDDGSLKNVGSYVVYSNYDAMGRPENISYGNQTSTIFSYSPVTKRLSELSVLSQTKGLLIDNAYGYDNKGNITSINDKLNKLIQTNLSSETYTPVRAHAVGSTGSGRLFQYDNNGNIKNDGIRGIIYNYDNMPTSIGTVGFTYDGNGTRVMKTSSSGTTVYVDKLYECTNGECAKYIFAGNTRIARKNSSLVLYYHPDHLWSTSVVTDASGAVAEEISYAPFGGTRQDSGIVNFSHKYTGQENDSETGLYNYNARIYDPDLGRFLTPDSIVPEPGNPQSLNRYSYVQNKPVNMIDPSGHSLLENLFSAPDPLTSFAINHGTKNLINRLPGAAGDIARGFDAAYRNQVGPGLAIGNGGALGGLTWLTGGSLTYSYKNGWGAHLNGNYKCFFGSIDWQEHGYNRGISTTLGIGANYQGFVAGFAGSYNFTQRGRVNFSLMAGYSGNGWYAGTSYSLNSRHFSGNAGFSVGQMLNITLPTSSSGGRDQTIASYNSSPGAIHVTGIEDGDGLDGESSPLMVALDVYFTHSTAVVHDYLMNKYGIQPSNVSGNVGLMVPAALVGTFIGGPVHLSPHAIGEIGW